jgi:phosphoribosyl 1,2-cyclic phosphodiesterase
MRILFLGSGASGGTPGNGRSRRRESSAVIAAGGSRLLIDVTRDFDSQREAIDAGPDAVLLTHAHRDACGGLPSLDRWVRERGAAPLPVYASRETITAAKDRWRRLDRCEFIAVRNGERRRIGPWTVSALWVPHAREPRFPTFAWRITAGGERLVYASDVARLTQELRRFARGAAALVIDAAMWRRSLFSHLTIDRELPRLCQWRVDRIVLTQIGKTLPEHPRLRREASALCSRALPAYDGFEFELGAEG